MIIDFIPNHMSNQSSWFQFSENNFAGYEDFFVWRDRSDNEEADNNSTEAVPRPPNNWVNKATMHTQNKKE